MTLEEKAKAYDEALGRANDILKGYDPKEESKATINYIFPELKESEDERIRKEIISYIKSSGAVTNKQWLAWLEKQGDQKSSDKVEPKFKIEKDKWYVCIRNLDDNYGTRAFYKGDIYHSTKDETLMPVNSNVPYEIKYYAEDYFRLWTIQDAKDGDVLVGKIDGDDYILIFKQIKDGWIETYGHYYDAVDRFCVPSQLFCRDYQGIFIPATKEHRDLLFSKMHEAGYEWDVEKKELKLLITNGGDITEEPDNKIEPFDEFVGFTDFEKTLADICIGWIGEEPGWKQYIKDNADVLLKIAIKKFNSVQDTPFGKSIYQSIMDDTVQENQLDSEQINWLKFTKSRIQLQEWTKEDEKRLKSCLNILQPKTLLGNVETINTKWLKSLKYRIQPIQEWNEEDEKYWSIVIAEFSKCAGKSVSKDEWMCCNDWLNSLRDRVHPKIEWSEEDNELLNAAIGLITDLYQPNDVISTISKHSIRKIVDWLKSLKQRHTWKPSDVQMQALKDACDKRWEPDGLDPLYTLYEDLEKLKGE